MSDEHKAALALGREQGRIVKNYLESLRANKPKRGRRRTVDSITARLDAITAELDAADPLNELKLRQERQDLEEELAQREQVADTQDYEDDFVRVAKEYAERQGISYSAWREVGVDAAVLKRAGVPRTRRAN